MLPLVLAHVVDAADVVVRNLARDADLAVEARERSPVGRELFGTELERDGLFEFEIVGAVSLRRRRSNSVRFDASKTLLPVKTS